MNTRRIIAIGLVLCFALAIPATVMAGSDPPPPTGFKVYPALMNVAQNSISMMWQTHNSSQGKIRVSLNSNMTGAVTHTMSSSVTRQKASIGGLSANTVYYYQVVADGETSPKGSFITALPKGTRLPFRFAVYGDSREATWYEDIVAKYGDNDDHLPVCISMDNYAPDFLLHVGDLVQDGNNTDQIYNFFDVEKELLASNPLIATYGNHEFSGGHETGNTKMDSFLMPGPSGTFSWYSYVYGNIKIIVLNTGEGVWPKDNFDVLKAGSAQYNWAVAQVNSAATDADIDHIFFSMHAPPYSAANFGDNSKLIAVMNELTMLSPKVKAVFMGHEHDYQHMADYWAGCHYILSGGAGSPILDLFWKGDDDDTAANLIKYDDVLNYVLVDVSGDSVTCQVRKVQGNGNSSSSVIENFSL